MYIFCGASGEAIVVYVRDIQKTNWEYIDQTRVHRS